MTGYVYLAAPYSTGIPLGVPPHQAVIDRNLDINRAAAKLMHAGLVVYSPVTHGCAIEPHLPFSTAKSHTFWMEQCQPLVKRAQRLVVLMLPGWSESTGVRMETEWAKEAGIPINYLMPGMESQLARDLEG